MRRLSTIFALALALVAPAAQAASSLGSTPTATPTLRVKIYDWVGDWAASSRRHLTDATVSLTDGEGVLRVSSGNQPNRKSGFELRFRQGPGPSSQVELISYPSRDARERQELTPDLTLGGEQTLVLTPAEQGFELAPESPDGDDPTRIPSPGSYEIHLQGGAPPVQTAVLDLEVKTLRAF